MQSMPPKDSKIRNRNMETRRYPPITDIGNPQRLEKESDEDGVSVVVRGRESRLHGKGRQGNDTLSKPEGAIRRTRINRPMRLDTRRAAEAISIESCKSQRVLSRVVELGY